MTAPGFGAPSHQQPTLDPPNPEATTVTVLQDLGTDPSPRGRSDDSAADLGSPPPRSSTTPKIGPSQVFSPDSAAFEGTIAAAFGLASMGLSWRKSPDTGAWIATEEEQAAIAEPLARIAARHVKVTSNGAASDLGDGLEAAFGIVGYAFAAKTRDTDAQRQQDAGGFSDLERNQQGANQ